MATNTEADSAYSDRTPTIHLSHFTVFSLRQCM
jgi:hypothetical protein